MFVSEKVKLIRGIVDKLTTEEWPDIDLVLSQFGFPIQETWPDDKRSYVIEMLKGESDLKIEQLAQHFDLISVTTLGGKEVTCWREERFRLFISHVSTHKKVASELKEALEEYGICGFVAHMDIEPTKEWHGEIEAALHTMDALVALVSPDFNGSKWTDQEVGVGIGRNVPVVPVRLGQDPYGLFGKYQALNGAGKSANKLAEEVAQILIKNKSSKKYMAKALVSKIEQAGSFAESKRLIGLLEQVQYLDQELISRLRTAIEENSQVAGSWSVPERIEELISKF